MNKWNIRALPAAPGACSVNWEILPQFQNRTPDETRAALHEWAMRAPVVPPFFLRCDPERMDYDPSVGSDFKPDPARRGECGLRAE